MPATRYARSGDVEIAYQTVGEGPTDLVWVAGYVSHLDVYWEDPGYRRFCERLGSFTRLILFDKRGMGLSDRVRVATRLVAGSGLAFVDRGAHELKGVPDRWRLYRVTD